MRSSYVPGIDNPHDVDLSPSVVPRFIQRVFLALLVVAFLVAVGFALTEHWRRATFLLGGALVWLSVIRVTCDSRELGVLAVRSRRFDALFTLLIGGVMAFLAVSVDPLGS
ncbi:DUF3017 domain-containing protein [Corynebacterium pygosceleis]|uniref:DUF3017 domain-containing protein n=1 Tax=Corynebacterium pygosceleis TaxID=2800406 RepID=A0A9Q4C7L2_9CORY|nr:DUF3017 domain-containing protein [Corynebacterium pygosceleis]MCK7637616.1 DUF3017 domain-containing protein [Corynebacterium pygosceleis]MCK7674807.1 DUF3017 domain-containing protein [Corynebacterium pygosceleis]MCL0119604.1 DUF3017 domain-containing protein [Corynebacterium pygosceleis]MCX7444845.1 DUF3017 domain-containing protein [Corynebacterium pygosceleis]MCX7468055.1 DUF3017 domain-containing protein [Corynebacterium pygosceleis]